MGDAGIHADLSPVEGGQTPAVGTPQRVPHLRHAALVDHRQRYLIRIAVYCYSYGAFNVLGGQSPTGPLARTRERERFSTQTAFDTLTLPNINMCVPGAQ